MANLLTTKFHEQMLVHLRPETTEKCGSAALSKERSALKGPKGNYESKPQLSEEHSTWMTDGKTHEDVSKPYFEFACKLIHNPYSLILAVVLRPRVTKL